MRRCSLLFALLLLALVGTVRAQILMVGLNAGKSFAAERSLGDALSETDGWTIGATADFNLFEPLTAHGEISYAPTTRQVTLRSSNGIETVNNYDINYLQLPIALKVELGSFFIHPYVTGGTTLGALLSATNTTNPSNDTTEFNSMAASLDLGAGAWLPLGEKWRLSVDARYSFGIVDFVNDATSGNTPRPQTLTVLGGIAYVIF